MVVRGATRSPTSAWAAPTVSTLVSVMFGAVPSRSSPPRLISGGIADRAKFGSWMIFAGNWATVVYFLVAAWVWGGGWIKSLRDTLGFWTSAYRLRRWLRRPHQRGCCGPGPRTHSKGIGQGINVLQRPVIVLKEICLLMSECWR